MRQASGALAFVPSLFEMAAQRAELIENDASVAAGSVQAVLGSLSPAMTSVAEPGPADIAASLSRSKAERVLCSGRAA
jgi:hypothetical protein